MSCTPDDPWLEPSRVSSHPNAIPTVTRAHTSTSTLPVDGPEIPFLGRMIYARYVFRPKWPLHPKYTIARAVELVRMHLMHSPQEHMMSLLLNAQREIISFFCASMGPHNTQLLESEDIFPVATEVRAHAIVLVHNHPTGPLPLRPSTFDLELTEALVKDGQQRWHIPILDHLILSNVVPSVFSFRKAKLLIGAALVGIHLYGGLAEGLCTLCWWYPILDELDLWLSTGW